MMGNHSGINFNHEEKFRDNRPISSCLSRAFISLLVVTVIIVVLHSLAFSAEKTSPAPAASKSEAKPEQKPKPEPVTNPITEAAIKAGMVSCADRINQMTNFLSANTQSDAIMFLPSSDPDRRLGSISLGLALQGGQIAYASESFAPNQANGCGGTYETVTYWEMACAEVATRQFSVFKQVGLLASSIAMLDGGYGVKIFLMPAGKGCVAIKKEVIEK